MEVKEGKDELFEGSGSAGHSLEDHASLSDEGYWNDNDLVLAAELGKALLDRNRMLEQALEKARAAEKERMLEIECLCKQLSELKKSNLKQTTLVEETDHCNQDLDRSNRRLMAQIEVDKRTIRALSNTVHQLEERLADLTVQQTEQTNASSFVSSPHIHLNYRTESCSMAAGDLKQITIESTTLKQKHHRTVPTSRPRASPHGQFIDDELLDQPNLGAHLSPERHHDPFYYCTSLPCTVMSVMNTSVQQADNSTSETSVNSRSLSACSYHSQIDGSSIEKLGKSNVYPLTAELSAALEFNQKPCRMDTPEFLRLTSRDSMQPDDFDRLNELLDDAMLIKRMEAIYEDKLACNLQTLTTPDYQPRYKSLFQKAFKILQDVRKQHGRSLSLPATPQLHQKPYELPN